MVHTSKRVMRIGCALSAILDDGMFEEVVVLYVQLDVFASTDGRKKRRNGSAVVVAIFV